MLKIPSVPAMEISTTPFSQYLTWVFCELSDGHYFILPYSSGISPDSTPHLHLIAQGIICRLYFHHRLHGNVVSPLHMYSQSICHHSTIAQHHNRLTSTSCALPLLTSPFLELARLITTSLSLPFLPACSFPKTTVCSPHPVLSNIEH